MEHAGAQFAEKAEERASDEHPNAEGARKDAGDAAVRVVDTIIDSANAAIEFVKDRIEEVTHMDINGDGQVGKIRPEDIEAGAELVGETVMGAVDKVAAEVASITPDDVQAGIDLAEEAVANAAEKVASITPGDIQAGIDLAIETVADAVEKTATKVASITPGDIQAGIDLAAETVADAVDKITGAEK